MQRFTKVRATAALAASIGLLLSGCDGTQLGGDATNAPTHRTGTAVAVAGASCSDHSGCGENQTCAAGVCRHVSTSIEGEVLAVGAQNQMAAGDHQGALNTFGQARQAFEAKGAPLPPAVACGAAVVALRVVEDEASREVAALEADRCFRNSLPGAPLREAVQAGIAKLRFDGIDLALFDAAEASTKFFVEEPSRPTADAIQVSIDLPASDVTGFSEIQEALVGEKARVAISACFVADWEQRHERSVTAAMVLRFRTKLRDMGSYDTFAPEVSVVTEGEAPPPFATCLEKALTESLQPGPRIGRVVGAWQEGFVVSASVP